MVPYLRPLHYEPCLDEILSDPIVRLVMDKDGADEADLRRLMLAVCKARFYPHHRLGDAGPVSGPS